MSNTSRPLSLRRAGQSARSARLANRPGQVTYGAPAQRFADLSDDFAEISSVELEGLSAESQPSFPYLILAAAITKDVIDSVQFTIVAAIIVLPFAIMISLILLVWVLGKASGGWWKKKIIRWLWNRYMLTVIIECLPLLSIVPASTIFVLMAHYRETKIVQLFNTALEEFRSGGVLKLLR